MRSIWIALVCLSLSGPALAQSLEVSQSVDRNTIEAMNSVNCNLIQQGSNEHRENSLVRIYDLATYGVGQDTPVTAVLTAVLEASSNSGSQPVIVRLRELSSPQPPSQSWLSVPVFYEEVFQVADTTTPRRERFQFTSPVVVPGNSILAVEIYLPGTLMSGDLLFLGANSAGESGQSYIAAGSCGIPLLTPVPNIGWPSTFWLLDLELFPGAPAIEANTTGMTGDLAFTNTNLVTGRDYVNVFSLTPCPGLPGSGPLFGLCFNDINDLLAFLTVPPSTPPVRFFATGLFEMHAPIPGLPTGFTLDAFCVDLTTGSYGPVTRLSAE